jgi:hypothetical protein
MLGDAWEEEPSGEEDCHTVSMIGAAAGHQPPAFASPFWRGLAQHSRAPGQPSSNTKIRNR